VEKEKTKSVIYRTSPSRNIRGTISLMMWANSNHSGRWGPIKTAADNLIRGVARTPTLQLMRARTLRSCH